MKIKSVSYLITSIIISIVVALIVYIITENIFSYLAGFLSFFGLAFIRLQILAEQNQLLQNKLINLFESIKINDKFAELKLIYNLKAVGNFKNDLIEVEKDDVLKFWYDTVSNVNLSFEVLTFVLPEETWDLGWHKIAIGIQQERIANGCKIERFFMVTKDEDLTLYKHIINAQRAIGIKTYKVFKEDLIKKKIIKDHLKSLGTEDFAIIDNSWLERVYLNRNRRITRANATRNEFLIKKARIILQEAKKIAVEWK